MLNVQVNSHVTPVENIGYEWEFFKSLCRYLFRVFSFEIDLVAPFFFSCVCNFVFFFTLSFVFSKKDQNSLLLLRFVITTLERDFHDRTCNRWADIQYFL